MINIVFAASNQHKKIPYHLRLFFCHIFLFFNKLKIKLNKFTPLFPLFFAKDRRKQ